MYLNKLNETMSDDKFEKLKQDIEGTLIELVDKGYKVVIEPSTSVKKYGTEQHIDKIPVIITITIKEGSGIRNQDIEPIKEYLHQLYDLMKYYKYSLNKVDVKTINFDRARHVRLLDKKTGKVSLEDDIYKAKDFESIWDSIDFCIFSYCNEPDKFYKIELLFN